MQRRVLVRDEGLADTFLLGHAYHALKISHYRDGSDGNDYRSPSRVWKDLPAGMLLFDTYQQVAGCPEIGDPFLSTDSVTRN